MAVAGVSDVYSVSNDLLAKFLGVNLAISQVYRVTNRLGEQLTQDLAQPVCHPPLQVDEVIYASIDGSMILTDEGWQEPGRRCGQAKSAIFKPKPGGTWKEGGGSNPISS